jgi:hypothetical protein
MEPVPAPYSPDTRAKGWRFELDYEQIEQSETWALAAEVPLAQHALLMMWLVAWSKQKPCGSFPNDENSIRAACRIPPAIWTKCRDMLMRGWWLADDGRLYHDTLVKRVLEKMGRRRSDSDRQAAKRARGAFGALQVATDNDVSHTDVTRDTPVTPPEVRPESGTDHRPPNTREKEPGNAPRKGFAAVPDVRKPDDVGDQIWLDWVKLRKGKRAAVTVTVLAEARGEAGKAGLSLERFLAVWCARGSQGLEAGWLKPNDRGGVLATLTNRQEAIEMRNREVGDRWLAQQEAMDETQ